MKRHNLPEQGIVTRYGAFKRCKDCFEDIYSEREWETSPCPGKRENVGAFIAPGEIKYKKKLRKYPSYQNHLNRKGK